MANFQDFAASTVATAPSPATSGTSLTVASGDGTTYPPVPFYATAAPAGVLTKLSNSEKVLVTARSGDVMTIVRAQGGTTAKSIAVGWVFVNAVFASDVFASSISMDEVLSGTVNGTNKVFTTASPFSSINVFKNGVAMHVGVGNDFTITGTNQITFTTAPTIGTVITATYILGSSVMISGSNSLITDEVPTGSVNGSNTAFTTSKPYVAGSLEVFINGVKQARSTHFTETTPASGIFTMSDAPITGDNIIVNYQYTVSATANADTVDGYHAGATPIANQIPVLNSRGQTGEWWEEIGRAIATGSSDSISTGTIVAKKYLLILITGLPSGAITPWLRFNNDSANNYAMRYSAGFGTGATLTSQSGVSLDPNSTGTVVLGRYETVNIASQEKVGIGLAVARGTAGAGNAPANLEVYGKWANTSDQITRVDLVNVAGAGDFAAGTELIVLGHD